MSIDLKNLGKTLYESTPKRKATLHLGGQQLSIGRAQELPDHLRFYPDIHAPMPAFQREPLVVTFSDTPHPVHVQMSHEFDSEQTDKCWRFYYLNP